MKKSILSLIFCSIFLFSNSVKPMDMPGIKRIKTVGAIFVAACIGSKIIYDFVKIWEDAPNWILIDAIKEGNLSLARRAIEEGADVNFEKSNWGSLLSLAYYEKNIEIIKLLIEKGSNIFSEVTIGVWRPYFLLCDIKRVPPLLHPLTPHDLRMEILAKYSQDQLKEITRNVAYFCFVVNSNNLFLTKLFIQHGANVNCYYFQSSALNHAYETKNLELIELLLENGARIDIELTLEFAERDNRQDIVDLLLKYCDSNLINKGFGHNAERFKFWSEKLQNHRNRFKEQINHFTENRTFTDIAVDYLCADNTSRSGKA